MRGLSEYVTIVSGSAHPNKPRAILIRGHSGVFVLERDKFPFWYVFRNGRRAPTHVLHARWLRNLAQNEMRGVRIMCGPGERSQTH